MKDKQNSKRALTTSLIVFLFSLSFWLIFILPSEYEMFGRDFLSYYLGAKIVKDGNTQQTYDIGYQIRYQNMLTGMGTKRILPYIAPITTSYVYYPFTAFNLIHAYKAFVLFQLLILTACVYLFIKELKVNSFYVPLLFLHPIITINIYQGQPGVLQLLFMLLSILLFKKQKYLFSGVILSLILLKPQIFSIIFFLFLLVDKNRFRIGTIIGSLFILFLNLLTYGKNFIGDYLKFLQFTDSPYYGSHVGASHTIKSLFELMDNILKTNLSGHTMLISLFLIGTAGLILLTKREEINEKKIDIEVVYGLSILISVPLSTHLLNHDLIVLALPAGVIATKFNFMPLNPRFWIFYLLTWTYYLMNISFLYNKSIIGVLLLLGFIYYYTKNLENFSRNHT